MSWEPSLTTILVLSSLWLYACGLSWRHPSSPPGPGQRDWTNWENWGKVCPGLFACYQLFRRDL